MGVAPADCYFYHTIDLPGLGELSGDWDFRATADDYLGHVALAGKRVLEIGPANGFFTAHMEGKGARVTAYDLSVNDAWDGVPYADAPHEIALAKHMETIGRVNNAWRLTRDSCSLTATVHYGSIYQLPADLGVHDVATLGAVLLHLRDPFLALQKVCSLAKETVVVTELFPFRHRGEWGPDETVIPGAILADTLPPQMIFQPLDAATDAYGTWWHLTPACVRNMLAVLGFRQTKTTFHLQRHLRAMTHVLYTVVATRA